MPVPIKNKAFLFSTLQNNKRIPQLVKNTGLQSNTNILSTADNIIGLRVLRVTPLKTASPPARAHKTLD